MEMKMRGGAGNLIIFYKNEPKSNSNFQSLFLRVLVTPVGKPGSSASLEEGQIDEPTCKFYTN